MGVASLPITSIGASQWSQPENIEVGPAIQVQLQAQSRASLISSCLNYPSSIQKFWSCHWPWAVDSLKYLHGDYSSFHLGNTEAVEWLGYSFFI